MLNDILSQIQKPGRYIGQEWNLPKKDFSKADIKFALCFPDLYEIGMSNLGVRIIYDILNKIADTVCERFFSPAADMENTLRINHLPIFSLESRKALGEFDLAGFSLSYELNYTNVLSILELGRIPLKSSLRDNSFPLIIGGGPCVLNPEPMHEFFDFFVIGEAEEAIGEIIDLYRKYKDEFKSNRMRKEDLLVLFSRIEGVYVPSLYEVIYSSSGGIAEFKAKKEGAPLKVKKRFVKNLDIATFPLQWLVPYVQIVHDRITMEIMRGCPNHCWFCQARALYFPLRYRSMENISRAVDTIYACTGYEEISLAGLSVSDYPRIEVLLESLISKFKEKGVSISLPSIKPKLVVGNLSALIATVKKTGLTFAPEAASEKLRRILNKDFNMDNFFSVIEQAYSSGYQRIKLYFMIGLPGEEYTDMDAIIDLAVSVSEKKKIVNRGAGQVNISINTLIPKPHTPFQWFKMQDLQDTIFKQNHLKERINKSKKLKLSFHNRYMSFLEGVFSRGDRRLSQVILNAFTKGAKFDAWEESFSFDRWIEAFKDAQIEPEAYLRERAVEEILPWDFLEVGINREILIKEFQEIKKEINENK